MQKPNLDSFQIPLSCPEELRDNYTITADSKTIELLIPEMKKFHKFNLDSKEQMLIIRRKAEIGFFIRVYMYDQDSSRYILDAHSNYAIITQNRDNKLNSIFYGNQQLNNALLKTLVDFYDNACIVEINYDNQKYSLHEIDEYKNRDASFLNFFFKSGTKVLILEVWQKHENRFIIKTGYTFCRRNIFKIK